MIKELEEKIRYHSRKYFQEFNPEISDREFDALVEKLRRLDPESAVLSEIADSQWFNTLDPVAHNRRMLSLDKAYDIKELEKKVSKFGTIISTPKVDGCALSLVYGTDGVLQVAATRGDGNLGENVTVTAKRVSGVLHSIRPLKWKNRVEVRGEVFVPLEKFEGFKEQFANPRNMAAGGLHRKFSSEMQDYGLAFVAYDILGVELTDELKKFELLEKLGFTTVFHQKSELSELSESLDFLKRIQGSFPYETDGIVFKALSASTQEELGETSHHPRYAVAYKFAGEDGETLLKEISWQVSRTGRINPVAILEPVRLSGAFISRVTLHSIRIFKELGLRLGDTVSVSRRGGVIPYLESRVQEGSGEILIVPLRCPACGQKTEARGEFLFCSRLRKCVGAVSEGLRHFLESLGCDGFGPATVETLVHSGAVRTPIDFWKLNLEDLSRVEGIGKKQAANLLIEIEKLGRIPLEALLCAVGVDFLGPATSRILSQNLLSLSRILEATPSDLENLPGIGKVAAGNIHKGIQETEEVLRSFENLVESPRAPTSTRFSGKVFVFSGKLESSSRESAEETVQQMGAAVGSGVTKNVDFVIFGAEPSHEKVKKAEKLAVAGKLKILTEYEWLEMMLEN